MSGKDDIDWKFKLFVYFIVIFYGTAGIFLCKELWPMVKDIWRSYHPDTKESFSTEKKTN